MPNSRSAKKRMRQAERRRDRNRQQRSTLRTAIKRVRAAENADQAEEAMRQAERLLDRAANKRLLHPATASRTKSRLRKAVASNS